MGEQDNVLSIPPALEQPLSEKKKKRKKKKKHKKKKKRQIKKEEQLTKVLPMLDDSCHPTLAILSLIALLFLFAFSSSFCASFSFFFSFSFQTMVARVQAVLTIHCLVPPC